MEKSIPIIQKAMSCLKRKKGEKERKKENSIFNCVEKNRILGIKKSTHRHRRFVHLKL